MAALFKTKALAEATLSIVADACHFPDWQRRAQAVPAEKLPEVPDYPDA
jgi:hypothetical protein